MVGARIPEVLANFSISVQNIGIGKHATFQSLCKELLLVFHGPFVQNVKTQSMPPVALHVYFL